MNLPSELPIIQAPMAGGPSTPELTAAMATAGGYGFVAGGYLTPQALRDVIETTRSFTKSPFGVNLFVPSLPGDPNEIANYAAILQPEAERLQVALGSPIWDDDAYPEKIDIVESAHVHLVSFTFGCPSTEVVEHLHRSNIVVVVTVTSTPEAQLAADVGADFLAVQGAEAGGHQGAFLDLAPNRRPLLSLLEEIRDIVNLPLIGAGGVMNGLQASAVLRAGASAVQIGTALLCASESETSTLYRAALVDQRFTDTIVTRAYSGRFARGLANRFAHEHDMQAPQAYLEVHLLTRPLRAAATAIGDADIPNLWAGAGWQKITAEPAGAILRRFVAEMVTATN